LPTINQKGLFNFICEVLAKYKRRKNVGDKLGRKKGACPGSILTDR